MKTRGSSVKELGKKECPLRPQTDAYCTTSIWNADRHPATPEHWDKFVAVCLRKETKITSFVTMTESSELFQSFSKDFTVNKDIPSWLEKVTALDKLPTHFDSRAYPSWLTALNAQPTHPSVLQPRAIFAMNAALTKKESKSQLDLPWKGKWKDCLVNDIAKAQSDMLIRGVWVTREHMDYSAFVSYQNETNKGSWKIWLFLCKGSTREHSILHLKVGRGLSDDLYVVFLTDLVERGILKPFIQKAGDVLAVHIQNCRHAVVTCYNSLLNPNGLCLSHGYFTSLHAEDIVGGMFSKYKSEKMPELRQIAKAHRWASNSEFDCALMKSTKQRADAPQQKGKKRKREAEKKRKDMLTENLKLANKARIAV